MHVSKYFGLATSLLGATLLFAGLRLAMANSPCDMMQNDEPRIVLTQTTNDGRELVTAVWADGTMLIRSRLGDIRAPLLVAQTNAAAVEHAIAQMVDAGFFEGPGAFYAPPSSQVATICASLNGKWNCYTWDERLEPLLADPENQSFARLWFQSRGAIFTIVPASAKRLSEALDESGKFRGYDPNRPERTQWFK